MVQFSNEDAAQAGRAIAELRTRMSLPKLFEFHFGVNSKRQREAFLETVGRLRFRAHVVAVDKSRLATDRLEGQSLYLWTLGMLLEAAGSELAGARLVIDVNRQS